MTKENNVKKIMITVNGKPVGSGLLIDKVTYAPVNRTADSHHGGNVSGETTIN